MDFTDNFNPGVGPVKPKLLLMLLKIHLRLILQLYSLP